MPGIQICRGAFRLNHLLIADDSVNFCKADTTNKNIQELLDKYEYASWGIKLIEIKTSMVFSKNVKAKIKEKIMSIWGGSNVQQYEKYLGLPPMVGKAKSNGFSGIKHRVCQKLRTWKEKQLSQGGKEVLLKPLALSIPNYVMSCFKLSNCLCNELESMMTHFWWGKKENERKIHWVS